MTVRWATSDEITHWDDLVTQNPAGGDFVLTTGFVAAKRTVGWTPRYLVYERAGTRESVMLVIEKRIPLLGRYWYAPRSPAVTTVESFEEHLCALSEFIRAKTIPVFAVTVEPPIVDTDDSQRALQASELLQSSQIVRGEALQPSGITAVVDINRTDEDLIASFNKKCRNMIRRAERDGVSVVEFSPTPEVFNRMHELMRLVGGGVKDLRLRSTEYTEALWNGLIGSGMARFFGIEQDGEPIVMAVVFVVGNRAYYKDSGSDRSRVSPGMSNFLHWEIMRTLRDDGAVSYDLFGVAPEWATSDADHPNYTGGRFKLSFADRVTTVGSFDLILRPLAYRVWNRVGFALASRLHRRRHNDLSLH